MCGVAGWIDWERDLLSNRTTVQEMVSRLACRGPDAEGMWVARNAAMTHRRLAVIDVPGGNQPMSAGSVVLAFSGEIHNFRDLRRTLVGRGCTFSTMSDTEVLLQAYREWGEGCLDRLEGMYAFAVWDVREERLLLARDRLGVKPLYYVELPGGVLFASELKALLVHPDVTPRLGREGIAELFTMPPGKTPGTGTYEDVRELPPGSLLSCTRQGTRERRYWRLESRPHPDDLPTTRATVQRLVEEAVSSRLTADVPLCTLLSGGVDSSVVTALAAGERGRAGEGLGTFSIGFSDSPFTPTALQPGPDTPYAVQVARHLGTDHREIRLDSADLLAHREVPLAARDLPGMGDMDVSLYLLFREISREHTVALSGEAADEVFRGYGWMGGDGDVGTFPWILPVPEELDIRSAELRNDLALDEYQADRYRDARAEVPHLAGEGPAARRQRELTHVTLTHFLPALLDRKDRLSMAVGLEVRVPYCDHRLVEYAWNVPHEMHRDGGIEKGLLRRVGTGLLPARVARRPKSHYPSTQSPAYARAVAEGVRAWLDDPAAPSRDLFDVDKVARILDSEPGYALTRPSLPWLLELDTCLRRHRVALTV